MIRCGNGGIRIKDLGSGSISYWNAHIVVSESVISPLTRLLTKPTFPDVSCRWWWAFEDVVLGFCVNPLLRTSLAGCLLLLIWRNLPGSWGGGGCSGYLSTNSEVWMEKGKFTCRATAAGLLKWSLNKGQGYLIKSPGLWKENAVRFHLSLIFPISVLMANKMH